MVKITLKKIKNLLLFVFIFYVILIPIDYCIAYWGWGDDCQDYHGIELIDIPYNKDISINLDGVPSESFWNDPDYKSGRIEVPLASDFFSPDFLIIRLNLAFIMNDNYLYILAQWLDNTTRPSDGSIDGVFFCWNIDVPNFSAAFWQGMNTEIMGGGTVDCWSWRCSSTSPSNGSSYYCTDDSFGENGWDHSPFDYDDVEVGYTYSLNHSYTVEFRRKLDTTHDYDVQINEKKLYLFNLGIINDGTHEDHAVSWTYALDLLHDINYNENKNNEGFQLIIGIIILNIVLLSFAISLIYYYIKKEKLRS